jgi:thioredoxin reductase
MSDFDQHTDRLPASSAVGDDLYDGIHDVVVVGGGVAGLSAALILARAQRRVVVLDAGLPRNRYAAHMHGVLGRDGYSPLGLVADGAREVEAVGGTILRTTVQVAEATGDGFRVALDDGATITGRRLVVATGGTDVLPNIPGLAEQWGRGVVACPYCDGYENRGRTIGVLAASIPGLHKAHMLRSYSDDLVVFTAGAGAVPDADRELLEARNMRVEERAVTGVATDAAGTLIGLTFDDGTSAAVDIVFAEPPLEANDGLLRQLGAEQNESPFGPWTSVDAAGRTSVPGVWAVGNAANPTALVPIAAGSGATAALAINAELVAADIAAAANKVASDETIGY